VFGPDHHVASLLERLASPRLVVLGTHGQKHAAFVEGFDVLLERQERFALSRSLPHADSLHPHLAHDSAPKGIVQIEDQDLPALASDGAHQRRHAVGVSHQTLRGAGHLCFQVEARIKPVEESLFAREQTNIVKDHVPRSNRPKPPVEESHVGFPRVLSPTGQVTKGRVPVAHEGVLDDRGTPPAASGFPQADPGLGLFLHQTVQFLMSRHQVGVPRHVASIDREEDDLRLECLDARVRRQQLLTEQSILALVKLRFDAVSVQEYPSRRVS